MANNKEDLIVDGFCFGSYEDAQKAVKEQKNAEYLEERVNSMSLSQLVGVYDKMLDQRVFQTPVGWEYLKYLKEKIRAAGGDVDRLRPIPIYTTFVTPKDNNDYSHLAKMHIKNRKQKAEEDANKLKLSIGANFFLALLVILMFIITLNSTNPNIINYKKAITDQYSAWEEELNEREVRIREREKQLEDASY